MKQSKPIITICMAFLSLLALCRMDAQAEPMKQDTVGYAVRPQLPGNQVDDQVGYFYLRTRPNQAQTLEVIVVNRNDEDIQVELQANTAFTNQNGVIEYTESQKRDDSPAIDFATLVTMDQPVLTVPANGEATAEFHLKMPEEFFEGEVLGGLLFTKLPPDVQDIDSSGSSAAAGENADGMKIKNVYIYCVVVRLTQSEQTTAPDFQLIDAQMGKKAGFPSLILHIRNTRPSVVKSAEMDIRVYQDGQAPVFNVESKEISMAPDSSMFYTTLIRGDQFLDPGTYTVQVDLRCEDQIWQCETPLTVSPEK